MVSLDTRDEQTCTCYPFRDALPVPMNLSKSIYSQVPNRSQDSVPQCQFYFFENKVGNKQQTHSSAVFARSTFRSFLSEVTLRWLKTNRSHMTWLEAYNQNQIKTLFPSLLTLSPLGPGMPAPPLSPGIPCRPGGPWAPAAPAGPMAPCYRAETR